VKPFCSDLADQAADFFLVHQNFFVRGGADVRRWLDMIRQMPRRRSL